MKKLPLFVYGTLRNGYGNYYNYLDGYTVKELPAKIKGVMYSLGAFPAVIKGDGEVHGELMFIDEKFYDFVLKQVDVLEGYVPGRNDNMYNREIVLATLPDGAKIEAYVYYWAKPYTLKDRPVVESGNWREFSPPYTYKSWRDEGKWGIVLVKTDHGDRLALTDEPYEFEDIIDYGLNQEEAVEYIKIYSKEFNVPLYNKNFDKILEESYVKEKDTVGGGQL